MGRSISLEFSGTSRNDSIVIGSHGNAKVKVTGNFDLSGVIYSPKYTITFIIEGKGRISFRGICHRIIIKKMSGNCLLDLSQVTCKEMECTALRKKSRVISGKVRSVSKTTLFDDASLHFPERPLIMNVSAEGNATVTVDA